GEADRAVRLLLPRVQLVAREPGEVQRAGRAPDDPCDDAAGIELIAAEGSVVRLDRHAGGQITTAQHLHLADQQQAIVLLQPTQIHAGDLRRGAYAAEERG